MAYIRNLSQADWFFNPTSETVPANPSTTSAPAATPPTMDPAQVPNATSEPMEVEEEKEEVEVPVIDAPKSSIGWYLLGGVGVIILGTILYKKFMTPELEEVIAEEPITTLVQRKKKRK